jgi:hypothetical protein
MDAYFLASAQNLALPLYFLLWLYELFSNLVNG